jgi:hypothetical protein
MNPACRTRRSLAEKFFREWNAVHRGNYGQTNEKYKENSRKSSAAYRKPITYSRASNFGSKNEM